MLLVVLNPIYNTLALPCPAVPGLISSGVGLCWPLFGVCDTMAVMFWVQ